jgi:hypothetical protein
LIVTRSDGGRKRGKSEFWEGSHGDTRMCASSADPASASDTKKGVVIVHYFVYNDLKLVESVGCENKLKASTDAKKGGLRGSNPRLVLDAEKLICGICVLVLDRRSL